MKHRTIFTTTLFSYKQGSSFIHRIPAAAKLLLLFPAGFAAFYLNRTNRSGILSNAGPIGGFDQMGNYLIDARFNRQELVRRVCEIAKHKSKIHLYNKDIRMFLEKYMPK